MPNDVVGQSGAPAESGKSSIAKTTTAKNKRKENGNAAVLSNGEAKKVSPQVDAFQFMMNSRHRSIGRNSPGRELDLNVSDENGVDKRELKARKSRLESWAEAKGASKRKREFEEVGNCIDYKLDKRARNLKKMLKIDGHHSDDEVTMKKKKKVAVIDSDSDEDYSSSSIPSEVEMVKLTPKSKKLWKMKIKLNMKENEDLEEPSQKKDTSLDEEIVIVDDGARVLRTRVPTSRPTFSDEDEEVEQKKKPMKMAPVFLKSTPKPKPDPKAVEARRQFLLSGVPSSLKKEMEKQQCTEEMELPIFPTISHVQQKSPDNPFWELPKPELKLTDFESVTFEMAPLDIKTRTLLHQEPTNYEINRLDDVEKMKKVVKDIKIQNPDYPVYRIFKNIYSKSGHKAEETPDKQELKRRGRKKKNPVNKSLEDIPTRVEENCDPHALWTEKYKSRFSCEMMGNRSAIASLKEWLAKWSNETKKKKKKIDSESDFETTDGDSRDSMKLCGNTVLLKGPNGCGKTAAVYSICDELNLNVLEVNASSKRTGKWLLQELQEATQSHQVRKTQLVTKEEKKPKMCVLLVEDVDLVFDQDEGFTAALTQIIATSKRPLILTTTGEPTANIQKLINNQQTIVFSPLSSIVTVWLQIVCLVEGCYVGSSSIDELLSYNKGDARRTLHQLQYFVSSGGHLNKNQSSKEIDILMADDSSNLSDLRLDENITCIGSLGIVKRYRSFSLPLPSDLETIWWNMPGLLKLPNFSETRLLQSEPPCAITTNEKEKLKELALVYDSLAFADVMSGPSQYSGSLGYRWRTSPKDSLSLDENITRSQDTGFGDDLIHTILSGRIQIYKDKFEGGCGSLSMAVPSQSERRWYSKQVTCEEKLEGALLQADYLGRKATALDYMPTLRAIARSECERALNNSKRRNRFCNYLRELGVHGGDVTYQLACNVFKIND